jgi:WhiB family transcriptional regulator, redox-sensing transcriptional regulator
VVLEKDIESPEGEGQPVLDASDANRVDLGGLVALTADSFTDFMSIRNWRDVASCRDTDPDLFFPVGTTGAAVDQISAAKAVCDACPAKEPCLQFAIENNQDSGVWGGTSEEERRQLRRAWVKGRKSVVNA